MRVRAGSFPVAREENLLIVHYGSRYLIAMPTYKHMRLLSLVIKRDDFEEHAFHSAH